MPFRKPLGGSPVSVPVSALLFLLGNLTMRASIAPFCTRAVLVATLGWSMASAAALADEVKFKESAVIEIFVVKAIQVMDETTLIGEVRGELVWIDDLSTDGMVDGKEYEYKTGLCIKVVGTKSYRNVLGAKKTIWNIRPETRNAFIVSVAQRSPEIVDRGVIFSRNNV